MSSSVSPTLTYALAVDVENAQVGGEQVDDEDKAATTVDCDENSGHLREPRLRGHRERGASPMLTSTFRSYRLS